MSRKTVLFFILSGFFICSFLLNFFQIAQDSDANQVLLSPSWSHLFGTDSLGRDYFVRVMQGTQISYLIGLGSATCTLFLGTLVGVVLGLSRNKFFIRFIDVYQSIPSFALVTVLCLFFQSIFSHLPSLPRSILTLTLSISLSHWMDAARIIRANILKIMPEPYIEGAVAVGASKKRIILLHVFPQLFSSIKVLFILYFPQAILYESFMSFVGLGIQSPATSWGALIHEGWSSLSAFPHLILFPGIMLFITLLLLQLELKFIAKD